MIRGWRAASSYGLPDVWRLRPCCPSHQLLAMAKRSKSSQELCDVPALTATRCRASLGHRTSAGPVLSCRTGWLAFASSPFLAQLWCPLCLVRGGGMLGGEGCAACLPLEMVPALGVFLGA